MKLEVNSGTLPRIAAPDAKTLVNGKPERLAWLVLFGAFFTCISLTLLVPILGFQFVRYSTVPVNALLQAAPLRADQVAPVRVTLPSVALPLAVIEPTSIDENSRVETDTTDNSRAFMTFFDNSTATIYKNSLLVLNELRRPQFGMSEQPNSIVVEQAHGVVRYGVASPLSFSAGGGVRPTQFLVRTPHFDAWLHPGSYALDVTDNVSQISVREGSAAIRSRDGSRELLVGQGQRVIADRNKPLADPIPAAQDLIVNGEFTGDVDCSPNANGPWRCYSDQGGDGGDVNGSAGVVMKGDRRAIQIRREGSNQNSARTGIIQMIDRDVSDYRSLTLSADVRVEGHNLSGGGYLSSEYPLILRIKYRDIDGNEREYLRGFYSQNDTNNPTANGELLPQGQWIPIDSSNLLASLPIKPFHILSIEIYASGWDYESYVSNVRLKAE